MKKILGLIITLMLVLNIRAFASDIFIQPAMQTRTSEQDRVWVGTFQLVWNDFMDKVVHGIVRFREGNPESLKFLNQQDFDSTDLSKSAYYSYIGKIAKKTKKKISKSINKKFGEASDILSSLDLTPGKNRYIVYTMLKKDFEFIHEFDKLGVSEFGTNIPAEYFGINRNSDNSLRNNIEVLFYNNPQDYAIILHTNSNDELYLYKSKANKEFHYIYSDIVNKSKKYDGHKDFTTADELKVPNINFSVEQSFDELTNKRIMGTNMYIQAAAESIRFEMDNKGVQLKSEGTATTVGAGLNNEDQEKLEPRYFYFDDTFVIFLKEKDKQKPYFALRVNDIRKFQ